MTDRKNVINLNIKGFSVQGRLEIYPWMIILIISWAPLASLTSNLSSPIFLRKFSTNLKFVKKYLKVQKWAGGHFSSRKSQGIRIFCQISQKTTAQWSKMHFFTIFMILDAIFWQTKMPFFHLRGKVNQFWQQIQIPWHFLDEKWPPAHFCTTKIVYQLAICLRKLGW